jgi:hypothetical protein
VEAPAKRKIVAVRRRINVEHTGVYPHSAWRQCPCCNNANPNAQGAKEQWRQGVILDMSYGAILVESRLEGAPAAVTTMIFGASGPICWTEEEKPSMSMSGEANTTAPIRLAASAPS